MSLQQIGEALIIAIIAFVLWLLVKMALVAIGIVSQAVIVLVGVVIGIIALFAIAKRLGVSA